MGPLPPIALLLLSPVPRPYLSMLKMKYEKGWWFQYVKIHSQKHARHLNQSPQPGPWLNKQ